MAAAAVPIHGGDNPTAFRVGERAAKCFACDWSGDVFDFYATLHPECDGPGGAAKVLGQLPQAKAKAKANGKAVGGTSRGKAYTTLQEALEAAERLPWGQGEGRLGKAAFLYAYPAANGRVTAYVARYERRSVVAGEPKRQKTFRPISLHGDGWKIADPPGKWPLYNLPTIIAAPLVLLFEGEKCCGFAQALGFAVTTSAHGAQAPAKTDWTPLAGKTVAIFPDRGTAGENYLEKDLTLLAGLELRPVIKIVRLPVPEDGDDLEQWLEERDSWEPQRIRAELARLIEEAPPWRPATDEPGASAPPGPAATAAAGRPIQPHEGDDDPHRLARTFLDRARHPDGLTLRSWREEWHRWDGAAYRVAPAPEIRGELTGAIKAEFDRINLKALRAYHGKGPVPTVRPVTTKVVGNVLQALTDLALLRTCECPAAPAWLRDDPPWPADEILPTRNALVHLPSLAAGRPCTRPPTPAFFCPYNLAFDFDPKAAEPARWLAFLSQLWPDDPQSIEMLQEWFGYLLTPDTSFQKMLLLIGPKRAGKGTIARVLTALVGPENVASPTFTKLATEFGLASLIGKVAAILPDARLSSRADQAVIVERLLSISGEDAQSIPRKYRDDWEGKLAVRLTLLSNELPKLRDASSALPSRMLILRLTQEFLGREDRGLFDALRAELPGILLWAVHGWVRLRARGKFTQPASGQDLVEVMEALASSIKTFLEDRCRVAQGLAVVKDELYAAWKAWCQENGREPGDSANLGRLLYASIPHLGASRIRRDRRQITTYLGVALKDPSEMSGQAEYIPPPF
jgi:putative DNA primase/helicase